MVKWEIGPKAKGREPKKRSKEAFPGSDFYKTGWVVGGYYPGRSSNEARAKISNTDENRKADDDKSGHVR